MILMWYVLLLPGESNWGLRFCSGTSGVCLTMYGCCCCGGYGESIFNSASYNIYTRCTRGAISCLGKCRIPRPGAGLSRKTLAYSEPRSNFDQATAPSDDRVKMAARKTRGSSYCCCCSCWKTLTTLNVPQAKGKNYRLGVIYLILFYKGHSWFLKEIQN